MEINYEDNLINRDIQKIKRKPINNLFSTKLNNNLTKFIMNYLEIKSRYEFAKTCIFLFNNFIDYENELFYEKKRNEIKNKICKITLENGKKGIGYFCIIHSSLYKLMTVLITNNYLINQSFLLYPTNKLELVINNTIKRQIDLKSRITYTNKKYDITYIQIFKDKDNINDFFELDYNVLNINEKEIYIFNHLDMQKCNLSYGKIINNNFFEFDYICRVNNISKGKLILNLMNNKIIGIHKEFNIEKNNGEGIFLNYFLSKLTYSGEDIFELNKYSFIPNYDKRLPKELKRCKNIENIDNFVIYPMGENLLFLQAILFGPKDSPYEGGKFFFDIKIPEDYPFKCPKFYLKTKIFHPYFIGNENKKVYIRELVFWNPSFTIHNIVSKIYTFLNEPDLSLLEEKTLFNGIGHNNTNNIIIDTNNKIKNDCFLMFTKDNKKYKKIAKNWTKKYA